LPAGAKIVIWQLVVAGVVFALARGRRLGWPVAEAPPSPIPSSELVHAVGRLYRRAQARDHAADLVRRATAFRLARRFGRPPGDGSDRLSNGLANAAGDDADALERLLDGPPPTTDEAFVASCRELEAVTEKIERVRG
jgi:hypothetical protein